MNPFGFENNGAADRDGNAAFSPSIASTAPLPRSQNVGEYGGCGSSVASNMSAGMVGGRGNAKRTASRLSHPNALSSFAHQERTRRSSGSQRLRRSSIDNETVKHRVPILLCRRQPLVQQPLSPSAAVVLLALDCHFAHNQVRLTE